MKKILNYRYISELFIIIVGLISGLLLFRNYGASWDEPDLYKYAKQSLSAYSIHDRVEGQFNLDSLLGPDNLRLYGPAYLLAGQVIVNGTLAISEGIPAIDLWHLVNYLMFVVGILFFYWLLRRWFKAIPALVSTLLFATQPVLFGISWIDPKDIPFMVFFIIAVYSGLKMVDAVETALNAEPVSDDVDEIKPVSPRWMKILILFSSFSSILSLTGWLFIKSISSSIHQIILGMDSRPGGDFLLNSFNMVARNTDSVPLDAYAAKAVLIFSNTLVGITIIAFFFTLFTLSLKKFPAWVSKAGRSIKRNFHDVFIQTEKSTLNLKTVGLVVLAGLMLGVMTSTRVLGPLAGLLVSLELFRRTKWKSIPLVVMYAVLTILVTVVTWPYLWENTALRFSEVFLHMAENPVGVGVLFRGMVYDSKELPLEYLPWLMAITLTIPVVLLSITGFFIFVLRWTKRSIPADTWIVAAWFLIPFGYVLIKHPPMYDNYRHFLFILPALFLFCALAIDFLMKINFSWSRSILAIVIITPGIVGIIQCHPYEYTYYNELIGGMNGAAGNYEVDYWLTCYRDLTLQVNSQEKEADTIFTAFMPDLVRYYADARFQIFKANDPTYPSGSLVFLPLRREGLTLYPELPVAYRITHNGVTLCEARRAEQ